MASVSPFSSTALSLLVRVRDLTPPGRQQTGNAADNILKAANGVSGEPSQGLKSATEAAGMLAVDLAQKSSGAGGDGKIGSFVIGNLGTFDTIDDARAYVTNNDSFSASEKKQWFTTLDEIQRDVDAVEKFKNSDLYERIMSGEFQTNEDRGPDLLNSRKSIESLNDFMIAHGRQGLPNFDELLAKAKYA